MKKNGFTLIEVLVSISIIAILSALLVANYKVGDSNSNLLNFQLTILNDLESIKSKAMNIDSHNEEIPFYWAIYLEKGASSYQIFADLNGNFIPDSGEVVGGQGDKYKDSLSMSITGINLANNISILFSTETGFPIFYDVDNLVFYGDGNHDLVIELGDKNIDLAKLLIINSFGLIDIADCFCNSIDSYCCSFCSPESVCLEI